METRLGSQAWTSAKTMETRYSSTDVPNYNRAIVYDSITGLDSLDIYIRVGTGSTFASLSLVDINITNPVTIDTTQICTGSNLTLTSALSSTSYQWQQQTGNGYNNLSGQTAQTLSLTNIQASSLYRCKIGNDTSQVFFVSLIVTTTPTIEIKGPIDLRQSTATQLTATVTHEGSSPLYQWMDSTSTYTWTNISGATTAALVYTPAKTGDKVLCKLTSNAACLSSAIAFSTPLTFTVQVITAVDAEPVSKYGIRLYPNPVSSVLALGPLKPTDGWLSLEIRNMDGKQLYTTTQIKNQTSISIPVNNLESGIYVVVLRGTNAKVATIKFVKM
jgi:hypothetical protein